MEDSELKWEDQARGGEDSRKGMAAEGTVLVVDGVTGLGWRGQQGMEAWAGQGFHPEYAVLMV